MALLLHCLPISDLTGGCVVKHSPDIRFAILHKCHVVKPIVADHAVQRVDEEILPATLEHICCIHNLQQNSTSEAWHRVIVRWSSSHDLWWCIAELLSFLIMQQRRLPCYWEYSSRGIDLTSEMVAMVSRMSSLFSCSFCHPSCSVKTRAGWAVSCSEYSTHSSFPHPPARAHPCFSK